MEKVLKNKAILIVTGCLALVLCLSPQAGAQQGQISFKPALLKQVLVSPQVLKQNRMSCIIMAFF